jgi:hypothetical protein
MPLPFGTAFLPPSVLGSSQAMIEEKVCKKLASWERQPPGPLT